MDTDQGVSAPFATAAAIERYFRRPTPSGATNIDGSRQRIIIFPAAD